MRIHLPKCLLAGAAVADQGAALIPETGDALRVRTRNGPETETGGREPDPGETALTNEFCSHLLCDGSSQRYHLLTLKNLHTETERKTIPAGGDPEPHPKATAQPEGHTVAVGESRQALIGGFIQHVAAVIRCLQLSTSSAQ